MDISDPPPGISVRPAVPADYDRIVAAADGRRVVRAITSPANSGSIAFHAAMGFTVTGPVRDYDGPGDLKMVFERRLG